MGRLIAITICSLDLRTADGSGDFGWAEPTREVHAFANDLDRPLGTHLYGRRMWETMRFWETMPDEDSVMGDYGRGWRATDKVVYSASLPSVDTARTRLERRFDPEAVRALVGAAPADVSIGGAALTESALRAGLVDEIGMLIVPVVIGSGPRALPDDVRVGLDLLEHRTFDGGWAFLRYRVAPGAE